jgi:hypothetical protein
MVMNSMNVSILTYKSKRMRRIELFFTYMLLDFYYYLIIFIIVYFIYTKDKHARKVMRDKNKVD